MSLKRNCLRAVPFFIGANVDPQTKAAVLILKGAISELPEETQLAVRQCANELKKLVDKHGECGVIALNLVAAETLME